MQAARRNVQREILSRGRAASLAWLIIIGFLTFEMHNAILLTTHQYGGTLDGAVNTATKTWLVVIAFVSLQVVLTWLLPKLMQRSVWQWGVIALQMGLTVGVGTWLNGGQEIMYMGMLPLILIESLNLLNNRWWSLGIIVLAYLVIWGTYGLNAGWIRMALMIQASLFTVIVVMYYWHFYSRQVDERMQAEKLLSELQLTYKQLEAATARNERERVARELHDTLTQGLAGVIMQLEAADNLLDEDQVDRARPIIKRSVEIARTTLRDSRLALTDLRQESAEDLAGRVRLLTDTFAKNDQLQVQAKLVDLPPFSPTVLTELTRCLSETLTNVVKHAATTTVIIRGQRQNDRYQLQVVDFGNGFDQTQKVQAGHYGLTGLNERMAAIGGHMTLISAVGEGTTVTFSLPSP